MNQSNAAFATKQPRIDALNAKLEEIGKKIGEAAGKGDLARAEALNKEGEAVSEQLRAIYEENDQTDRITPAGEGAKPIAKAAGVHSAFRRSDDPNKGTAIENTVVFPTCLGPATKAI